MTDIFEKEDFERCKKQRKNVLTVFYIVTGIYALGAIGLFVYFLFLPYQAPEIGWVKWGTFALTAVYVIFAFVFLGIKFKRVNRYYHMFKDVDVGLKEEWTAEFLRFEENIEVKDGVDFKCLIFSEWSEKKQEFFERKVLFDAEKEFPPITAGMKVRFVTQANILLSYEIQ
ncbi:MAG: hypothetical protein KH436_07675 [Firmicutes bacterium]|jgi:hypothetical protein|nr:hypothetical protein [Clostridia bacterium]MBS6464795.1 hypothetical protein [Bacillota bacterium]